MLHHRPPGSVRAAIVPLPPDWRDRQTRLEQQIQAASCTGAVPSLTSVGSGENQTKRSIIPTQEASSLSLALASVSLKATVRGSSPWRRTPSPQPRPGRPLRAAALPGEVGARLGHTRNAVEWITGAGGSIHRLPSAEAPNATPARLTLQSSLMGRRRQASLQRRPPARRCCRLQGYPG